MKKVVLYVCVNEMKIYFQFISCLKSTFCSLVLKIERLEYLFISSLLMYLYRYVPNVPNPAYIAGSSTSLEQAFNTQIFFFRKEFHKKGKEITFLDLWIFGLGKNRGFGRNIGPCGGLVSFNYPPPFQSASSRCLVFAYGHEFNCCIYVSLRYLHCDLS